MKIVTHNKNKYIEYRERFESFSINLEWVNMEYAEIQADDLGDIVRYSINSVKGNVDPPFFLEDAGLFIDALSGFPGPYSSYVQSKIGNRGILKLMENVSDRSAKFIAVIGYYDGKNEILFTGISHGEITNEEKGSGGFGYDPIFRPEGSDKTFAEMGVKEKNLYSHRSRAFDEFMKYIKKIR